MSLVKDEKKDYDYVPEITESEKRIAEADAYLRLLAKKQNKVKQGKLLEKVKKDMDVELSQLSSWTGESIFDIKNEKQ